MSFLFTVLFIFVILILVFVGCNMIKKIFSYDFEEARNNNNNPPFVRMILDLSLIILLIVILLILKLLSIDINLIILLASGIYVLFFTFKFFSDFSICCRRMMSQMSVFVVKKNGDIFKIVKTNYRLKHDDEDEISINQLVNGDSSKVKHFGVMLGFFFNIKSSKDISIGLGTDSVIKKILKSPEKLNDGIVYRINKVYELVETKRYYVIRCDYYDYNLDKDCINSLVKFNKSYKDYEQLADVIKGKICGQEDID